MTSHHWAIRGHIVAPDRIIEHGAVLVERNHIAAVYRPAEARRHAAHARTFDVGDALVYPGFVNLHVHGALGRDFTDPDPASAEALCGYLATQGYTSFLATLVSCSPELRRGALAAIRTALASGAGHVEGLRGIHFEGPFLHPDRRGAHRPDALAAPSIETAREMVDAAGDLLTLVTLAPELDGAGPLIDYLRSRGTTVALGHSTATCDQARTAIARGVRHAVHLFNAMTPFHHREPGVPGAYLCSRETTVEIVPDRVHAHVVALRLALAARGVDGVVAVTDSIPPAGMGDGAFDWLGRTVTVNGTRATLPDGTIAGSVLDTPALLEVLAELDLDPVGISRVLSTNPARVVGLESEIGAIAPGLRADLTVVSPARRPAAIVRGGVLHTFA